MECRIIRGLEDTVVDHVYRLIYTLSLRHNFDTIVIVV